MQPTLALLVQDFTTMPTTAAHPSINQIREYLRRAFQECGAQGIYPSADDIDYKGRLLLAQTLFQRCLSLISNLQCDSIV